MAIINHETREVQFKIVYCGPALSGKTTNLTFVHSRLNRETRGDLISIATSADRTLFFDFLPVKAMIINGYSTKFQLYTVPGQVVYNATRQLVMRGADGIIFVADSNWDRIKDNVDSFANLEENLAEHRRSITDTPVVLQYNKRDQENPAPLNYLDYSMNNRAHKLAVFQASAGTGSNVFATLDAVSRMVLQRFHDKTLPRRPVAAGPAPVSLHTALPAVGAGPRSLPGSTTPTGEPASRLDSARRGAGALRPPVLSS